eukprot:3268812-Prymnesium_polylepis.1
MPPPVDVNAGSDQEMREASSMLVPRMPVDVASRIVRLRPYTDDEDLLLRVNAGALRNRGKDLARSLQPVCASGVTSANAAPSTDVSSLDSASTFRGRRGVENMQPAMSGRPARSS